MSMRRGGSTGLGEGKKSNSLPQALPWWVGLQTWAGVVHLDLCCISCPWGACFTLPRDDPAVCCSFSFPCSSPEDAGLSSCCRGSRTSPAAAGPASSGGAEGGEACPWRKSCACSPEVYFVSDGWSWIALLQVSGREGAIPRLLANSICACWKQSCKQWMEKGPLQRSCSSECAHSSQLVSGFYHGSVTKGFTRSLQKLEFSFLGAIPLLLDALGLLFSFSWS